jgi:hypothetical protein
MTRCVQRIVENWTEGEGKSKNKQITGPTSYQPQLILSFFARQNVIKCHAETVDVAAEALHDCKYVTFRCSKYVEENRGK